MSVSTSCCAHLSPIPHINVAYPNSVSYNSTERAYFSIQEGSLTPSCIAKPTCADDVAQIISKLVSNKCQFAVKGGGHFPSAGFANIDDGITIDMTGLSAVSVNGDHSVANVGAGAHWLDVYTFLDPLNKTVAGGRNGAVGVGGLTLGGGISYFSPEVGWTCDTVVNFEVALASGHLVDANAVSHPDLFRALKGGLNNFGIVTRIDFRTIPIGEILAGGITNDISHRQAVFAAFVNIANARDYDVHASIVLSLTFSSATKAWSVSTTPIYTKPETNPPVYKELFAVPNNTNTMHLTPLHTLANESAIPQLGFVWYTATYGVSSDLLNQMFDIANTTFYNSAAGVTWLVTFEPLPTVITARGAGSNSMGTSPLDGNGMVLLLTGVSPTYSASLEAQAAAFVNSVASVATKMGMLHCFQYANYANEKQDPIASYGAGNEAFLLAVGKKYDPSGVFQKLVPGGFKLQHS